MIKTVIITAFLLFEKTCIAQSAHAGSGYAAVGTYSKNFVDIFSFAANQASLSQIHEAAAGLYSERRFMLAELTLYSAVVAVPVKSGGLAYVADLMGNKDYSQSKFGIAYGRTLGEKAGLGIQFNYNRTHIAGYGNVASIGVEIGSILHITEKLQAGFHVYDPFSGRLGNSTNERTPSVYTFGLGYEVSEQLLINTIIEKEENRNVQLNVALHYAPVKQFFVRAGIASAEGLSFAGAGLLWKNFRTDVCASWHPQLGFSPSILLIFSFKQQEQQQ